MKYILISLLCVLFVSCEDYLDVSSEVSANLTTEEVFNNPDYTRKWHRNIYNCISEFSHTGSGASNGFTGIWCVCAGEICSNANQTALTFLRSGYNASNASYHRWTDLYRYIRQASIFIDRVKPLGNLGDQAVITEEEAERMKMEAKYLIAYSYFSLFELYGPVPLLEEIADPETSNLDYARASVDEVVGKIDELLKEVIDSPFIPASLIVDKNMNDNSRYNLNEIVRPTKVAAMALRAKLWIYAASKLFNGGFTEALEMTNPDGKKLYPGADKSKWNIAKERLEELFKFAEGCGHQLYYTTPDKDGYIDPNLSYYELFQTCNDEILWATPKNGYNQVQNYMEGSSNPRDLYNGWCNIAVSQNIVDAFFVNDGLSITDNNSVYREDGFEDVVNVCNKDKHVDNNIFNMYANREPRFYASVVYHGKSWHIQPTGKPDYAVKFSKGDPNDNSRMESPLTGYLFYKFKNRSVLNTGSYPKKWGRPFILFRLADFYLYYAEVCNELNPQDKNIIEYIDKVRDRAGIPGYAELAKSGKKNIIGDYQKQMAAIKQERIVELLGEGQRYFDIRRWMDEEAASSDIIGLNMNGKSSEPIGTNTSFYRRIPVVDKVWNKAMFLYPIPQSEINKSKLLVQNPLW